MHDQLTRLDIGRCDAPAPYYFYKDGKLVCQGAGDSHLPRSMRARSPHVLSPSAVPPLTDEKRSFESRRAQRMTAGNSAGALVLDKSSSRHRAVWTAPAGGFRAAHDQLTQLDRGRCGAPAPYYFYKDGKLVCRGTGDSHLPLQSSIVRVSLNSGFHAQ